MTLYLLARIADEAVALPAAAVGSVVELGRITPVPRAPAHVLGLCALRSRVLTVIGASPAIGGPSEPAEGSLAVTLDVEGHAYALVVTGVDDVIDAPATEPIAGAFAPCWLPSARGVVTHGDTTALLIDPAALIAGPAAGSSVPANRPVTALL